MKKIVFYAPIGTGVPQHQLGGGEKGCRRTIEIITDAGYEVHAIDKPVMESGILSYLRMAIKAYIKVLKLLVSDKESILYVVGFYEKNVYPEWLNVITGRILGRKVIYEARNGRLVKAYYEYGRIYRMFMDNILKKTNLLFAQGLEYVDFIKEKYGRTAIYTPNYVMNKSLKPYLDDRSIDTIRLLYFGRVSESKNVEIVISTASELEKLGFKTHTTIIGGYTDSYRSFLEKRIIEEKLSLESIIFMGSQSFDVISEILQSVHFFVFPSKEKMEGHSNSLTEAMTFGVVPIVSNAGFNASVVSKPELVIEDLKAEKFAKVISDIIVDGKWPEYSHYVYERVKNNYTEDIVKKSITAAIENL